MGTTMQSILTLITLLVTMQNALPCYFCSSDGPPTPGGVFSTDKLFPLTYKIQMVEPFMTVNSIPPGRSFWERMLIEDRFDVIHDLVPDGIIAAMENCPEEIPA